MRGRLQCYMWMRLDGMGIIGRRRYSKSTFGANKLKPNSLKSEVEAAFAQAN